MITQTVRPEAPARTSGRRHHVTVGSITAAVALVYSVYALVRFWAFRTTTYDLVIFDQAVRSYSHFHAPTAIAKGVHNGFGPHFSVLGDHFSPILVLLAPLYWIHDGPETLLVAQSVLLAVTIVPLWAFTRRRLGVWQAYTMTGVYALAWPVAETLAFDFHEMAFTPVLSMLLLERHDAGRRGQYAVAAGALLLVKEDMGLLVAGFGLYLLTLSGDRRRGAVFVVSGLMWTWLTARVLVPAFGGSANYYWGYDALGGDLPHVAGHALARPWDLLRLAVTPHVKVTTMLWLLTPVLLLPLASPITLAVVPLLAERMLSNTFPHWWVPKFHYNVALTALLVAAGVDGAVRLRGLRLERVWPVAALVTTVAIVPHFAFKRLIERDFYRRGAHERAAALVLTSIPDGALVEAANSVGPRLSRRTRVLLWDEQPRWAPWVVADVQQPAFPFPSVRSQRDQVRILLDHGYTIVRRQDGYVVLNRPGSVPDLGPASGRYSAT